MLDKGDWPYVPKMTGEQLIEAIRAYLIKTHTAALKTIESTPVMKHESSVPGAEAVVASLNEVAVLMRAEEIEFEQRIIRELGTADLKYLLNEINEITEEKSEVLAIVYAALTGEQMPSVE